MPEALLPHVRKPRLLVVVTHPVAARVLMRGQLAYLRERGFEVAVAASPGPDLVAVAAEQGVTVFPVNMRREISPFADVVGLIGLLRVVREFDPDIVNAGTPKAGLLGMLAARLCRVPQRVYALLGLRLETTTGAKRLVLKQAERTAVACARTVVCVSESLRRRAAELGLFDASKTMVLGPGSLSGVDVERYQPRAREFPEAVQLRRQLALAEGAPVVGFVGRLTRDKGVGDLLLALEQVVWPRFPDARALLIGDFEVGDPVPTAVRDRLRADRRVVLPGFSSDTAPCYSVMDVLAFPSYREGLPNAPLEAAASGVPVAGYAATGTVDAVADGVSGTLVPVGDALALGEAICSYLGDEGLQRQHGEAGRERAVREFRHEIVWAAWERLYRELLGAARVKPG